MLGIVTSFFSPCDYALPKQYFAETVKKLAAMDVPFAITQATLPGQEPQPVPQTARHAVYPNAEIMFYKENLWNLAVDLLPDCDSFVFLDSDILLTGDWYKETIKVLKHVDVSQPFYRCQWLDKDGKIFRQQISASRAIQMGDAPWPQKTHPGFGLAITREAYNKLGGLYELFPAGGGDAAFWFALSPHPGTQTILGNKAKKQELNCGAPKYVTYRQNALAQNLRIRAVANVVAIHRWHGDLINRRYSTREMLFPQESNGDAAVARRPDGLLQYTQPAPLAHAYFAHRKEDG